MLEVSLLGVCDRAESGKSHCESMTSCEAQAEGLARPPATVRLRLQAGNNVIIYLSFEPSPIPFLPPEDSCLWENMQEYAPGLLSQQR